MYFAAEQLTQAQIGRSYVLTNTITTEKGRACGFVNAEEGGPDE